MIYKPKVSVIIPTYNNCHYITKAIESVLNQTYKDFEIIVVDDGSDDNTSSLISKYGRKLKYFYQCNSGAASARNKGINESKGEYISFLDSDDYFYEDNLLKKIAFLERNLGIGLVFSDWNYVDEIGNYLNKGSLHFHYAQKKLSGLIFGELLYKRNFIATPTVIIRRYVLEDIGLFDPTIPSQEEYDLWLRISSKYSSYYINEPLVNVIVHAGSLSSDFEKWTLGNALIVDKLHQILPKDFIVKKGFVNRLTADKFTFLARNYVKNNQFKNALNSYWQSIKYLPLQKRVYWLIIILLFRSIKYYFTSFTMIHNQK